MSHFLSLSGGIYLAMAVAFLITRMTGQPSRTLICFIAFLAIACDTASVLL